MSASKGLQSRMTKHQRIFHPATVLRINSVGAPGERTFFLQGGNPDELVTILIEKVQIQMLAIGVFRLIDGIESERAELEETHSGYDEEEMQLILPVDPLFRADQVSMGYDLEEDLLLLQVAEDADADEQQQVIFWVTREKMHGLALWALELAGRGKPAQLPSKRSDSEGNGFHTGNNGHKS